MMVDGHPNGNGASNGNGPASPADGQRRATCKGLAEQRAAL